MDTHKCKLCTRSFSNGRALGGHMKAHLAILPLPRKIHHVQSASTSSSSSRKEEQKLGTEEKPILGYVLRENPKRSLKLSSITGDSESIVQDRESETESKLVNSVQSRRSNRKKQKPNEEITDFDESPSKTVVRSSVSDFSPEEDLAMCLMMLSRDVNWMSSTNIKVVVKSTKIGGKLKCEKCKKLFRSSQALGSHRRVCSRNQLLFEDHHNRKMDDDRIFECSYCYKVFGSGQALGGHKRSHLSLPNSMVVEKTKNSFIDLNLPAPLEDDDQFSFTCVD